MKKLLLIVACTLLLTGCYKPESKINTDTLNESVSEIEQGEAVKENLTDYEKNLIYKADELKEKFPRIYHLASTHEDSDFNYNAIDIHINSCNDREGISDAFEAIGGDFTVYKFIATYKDLGWCPGCEEEHPIEDFHMYLIIKTNENHEIIDAYAYLYEWSECPNSGGFYKMEKKGVVLKNQLNIDELKLVNIDKSLKDRVIDSGTINIPKLISEDEKKAIIADIKIRYNQINPRLNSMTTIERDHMEISTEGGHLKAFMDNGKPAMIREKIFGEMYQYTRENFFWNDQLFFAYEKVYDYKVPMYVDEFNLDKSKITENRFYFKGNKLIKWTQGAKEIKNSEEFYKEEKWLLGNAKVIVDKIMNPDDWTEYKNNELGFKMKIPGIFKVRTEEGSVTFEESPTSPDGNVLAWTGGGPPSIVKHYSSIKIYPQSDLQDFIDTHFKNIKLSYSKKTQLPNDSAIEIMTEGMLIYKTIVFSGNNKIYTAEIFTEDYERFDRMLSTFEIIE